MKIKNSLLLLCFCAATFIAVQVYAGNSEYEGMSGDRLLDAIRSKATPRAAVPADRVWSFLYETDVTSDGHLYCPWVQEQPLAQATSVPEGYCVMDLIPEGWWMNGDNPVCDLYNLAVGTHDVIQSRGERLPGELSKVLRDFTTWQTGHGLLGGNVVDMYAPPRSLRGDIARIVMYVAVVYPSDLHSNTGFMVFGDGRNPGLSPDMYAILQTWHQEDPVDEYERRRNEVFSQEQGNVNPFVEHPELDRYIWGDKAGKPFTEDGDSGGETMPVSSLKGEYSIAEDCVLGLSSPYVPADATWYIDGVEIIGSKELRLAAIGAGRHVVGFISSGRGLRGKVVITINP